MYIDYRYFDAYNVTPRYEIGYGLSYTNFTHTDLIVPSIEALASTLQERNLSVDQ